MLAVVGYWLLVFGLSGRLYGNQALVRRDDDWNVGNKLAFRIPVAGFLNSGFPGYGN